MAKKRKTRASQPSQDQPPVDEQPVAVKEEEQEPEEEEPYEENQEEINEQDEEEQEEEEQSDEETTGNDVKEVKIESNGEDLTEEPVEKLLEPFSKEQLVLLMKEAVSKYPDLIGSVEKIADADPAHRKIFVHGLGWDTTTETLIREYSKYGEIEDCKAVVDKTTGKSKGYGFILFKHRAGARKALKEPQKKIGNRITSCQLASAGPVPAPPPNGPQVSEYTQRKIFVSNVAAEIDPQKLTEFFAKFGEIEEGPLGLDKQTGKPKGFALFVYKSIESAKKALEEPHKIFEGHTLNCQKAVDGPKPVKGGFGQHQQFGGHHHQPSKKAKYSGGRGGGAGQGHMMASSGPPVGYSPPIPPQGALTPVLGQALTAFLASQGAGLGIGNLLGGLGAPANPQGMPHVGSNPGYGNQGGAGYQQGGYANPQMGQGGSRPQQGGGYMGQGH
ncbi:putative RNA recognition motif domain, nucleotide-binding alpha-beta plait domain superfamily [Helianthus annuus]|uniref:RNA recognition motif domain, nucleotide-binding alpha-beta plait domain superfamily n=1 Tax=Helianthus annuus TaxID=4232 RepID=A0A9K3E6V4_HELAN|nr:UBP1-associated protein 2A [Helianthus annuus]XP_022010735.1 UBP1-associated protein 2A [Helianthus annuus]KAF5768090.1 putative RNA recognition motif domain, nucleotide-binding alpha-beta plait domain superfamily [Helianthus annuus]KAJ0467523.1 putative RNA recognition motif domain, nucleotide-binding alpha-beta plait domain superfamily [Helianthus annuus]KAJ0484890.1 putative RNA recognition motif domain, nucleotide-binding alpha-beta plait domain superfamily [Helianthus annuus]KAJ0655440